MLHGRHPLARGVITGLLLSLLHCADPSVAQWKRLPPVPESQPTALALYDSLLVLGTEESGIYTSRDLGSSWTPSGSDVPERAVIKSFTRTGSMLFAAAESLLFRSTDMAGRWDPAGVPQGAGRFWWVHGHGELVFAKMDSGMFVSHDFGGTWVPGSFGPVGNVNELFSCASGVLLAQAANGFFRSEDGGSTWVPSGSGLPNGGAGYPGRVRALLERGDSLLAGGEMGLVVSGDQGETWVQFNEIGLPFPCTITGIAEVGGALIAEDPAMGFYELHADSSSWVWIRGRLFRYVPEPLLSREETLIGKTSNGVMRSDDRARTWQLMANGLRGRSSISSICDLRGEVFGLSPLGNLFRLRNDTAWDQVPGPLVRLSVLTASGSTLIAGLAEGTLMLSTDRGSSWVSPEAGPTSRGTLRIQPSRPSGSTDPRAVYYLGSASADVFFFYRSTDDGVTWSKPGTGAPYYPGFLDAVGHTVIVSSLTLPYWPSSGDLLASRDAGSSWQRCDTSTGVKRALILDSVVLGFSSDRLQVSSDLGASWAPHVHPVDSLWTFCSTAWRNTWFAARRDAVYWLTLDSVLETLSHEGLSDTVICSLEYIPPYLYARLGDLSWWRLEIETPADAEDRWGTDNHPGGFRLEQNYPNPFNPATAIVAQWPATREVRLTVFDILGREVATLGAGRYPPGRYRFTFEAAGLPSGIYICRLQAGGYRTAIKMLLLR